MQIIYKQAAHSITGKPCPFVAWYFKAPLVISQQPKYQLQTWENQRKSMGKPWENGDLMRL